MPRGSLLLQVLGVATFLPSVDPPVASFSSQSMFIAAASYSAAVLGLLAWSVYHRAVEPHRLPRPTPVWRVAALKIGLFVGMHVLSVAVFASLLAPLYCPGDGPWLNEPTLLCGSSAIGVMSACGVLLALPLIATHVTVALVVVNRVPDPDGRSNLLCAPHGRVQAVLATLRFVRVCFAAIGGGGLSPTFQTALDLGLGTAWLVLYFRFLPYHAQVRGQGGWGACSSDCCIRLPRLCSCRSGSIKCSARWPPFSSLQLSRARSQSPTH